MLDVDPAVVLRCSAPPVVSLWFLVGPNTQWSVGRGGDRKFGPGVWLGRAGAALWIWEERSRGEVHPAGWGGSIGARSFGPADHNRSQVEPPKGG